MKKVLFIAAMAAIAATSCTKTEELGVSTSSMDEGITFSAYASGMTKAQDITTTNITSETFLLEAYKSEGGVYNTGTTSNYFSEYLVNPSGSKWYLSDAATDGNTLIYFWPTSTSDYLSFFATNAKTFAEDDTDDKTWTATSLSTLDYTSGSYPTFSYTVNTKEAVDGTGKITMQDLLVAATMNQNTESSAYNTVALNTKHALAKLNFKAKGSADGGEEESGTIDYTYHVVGITVSNLYGTGTFSFAPVTTGTFGIGSWTATGSATASYTYAIDSASEYPNGENTDDITLVDATTDNSLLVLPQGSGTTLKVEVKFYVTCDIGEVDADGDSVETVIYPLIHENDVDTHVAFDSVEAAVEAMTADGSTLGTQSMEIALGTDTFELTPNSQTVLTLVLPSPGDILTYKVAVEDWDTEVEYEAVTPYTETTVDDTTTANTTVTTVKSYNVLNELYKVVVTTEVVDGDDAFVSKTVVTTEYVTDSTITTYDTKVTTQAYDSDGDADGDATVVYYLNGSVVDID